MFKANAHALSIYYRENDDKFNAMLCILCVKNSAGIFGGIAIIVVTWPEKGREPKS